MSPSEGQGSFEHERTRRDQEPVSSSQYLRRHKGLIVGAIAIAIGVVVLLVAQFGPVALLDTGVGINGVGLIAMLVIAWQRVRRGRT